MGEHGRYNKSYRMSERETDENKRGDKERRQ